MKEMILNINGMHCMGCALGVEEELEKLSFIESAKVSLKDNNVTITFEEGNLDMDKINEVVNKLGFSIV